MKDNMCFTSLDPNHCRQSCPYNVNARRICNQERKVISIETNGQIFCQGQNNNANQLRAVPQNNAGRNQPNQANQGRPQQRQNAQGPRNGGRPNIHSIPPRVRVNRMQVNQDDKPIARVHAAVEHQGTNQQFAVFSTDSSRV